MKTVIQPEELSKCVVDWETAEKDTDTYMPTISVGIGPRTACTLPLQNQYRCRFYSKLIALYINVETHSIRHVSIL